MDSLETAAADSVTLIRFVLSIRQLDPDSGSQCTHRFALQKAAAVRVSAADENPASPFLVFLERLFITGNVTSPNFPDNYSNNLKKTETIEVESGKILLLVFTHFDVQDCGNITTCPCDFVKIRDGDGITLMDRSCGYSSKNTSSAFYFLPLMIMTRSNHVEIFFGTDDDQTTTGWRLSWRAVTPGLGAFNLNNIFILHIVNNHNFKLLK